MTGRTFAKYTCGTCGRLIASTSTVSLGQLRPHQDAKGRPCPGSGRDVFHIATEAEDLPEPTARPCAECPWLRTAVPGHLGPANVDEWLQMAHGETAIACHMTVTATDERGEGSWSDPKIRQCAGAAIFRSNICKMPRNRQVVTLPGDTKQVFSWDNEFRTHHEE